MPSVLVAHGSQRGGTAELADVIAEALRGHGLAVECVPAAEVTSLARYDAVVLGGALYGGRWARVARRFVSRHATALRARPLWLFSSGPLDDSANQCEVPPPRSVAAIARRLDARGHHMFGGRLAPDATGFITSTMARRLSGDWRDFAAARDWADQLAPELARVPRPQSRTTRPAARWPLALLCGATGITAMLGGALLVIAPDGSLLRAPLAALRYSPFSTFLVPGLVLLLVVGMGNAIAAWRVARDTEAGRESAFVAGVILLGWIVGEMLLLRTLNWLQLGYLAIAIAIVFEAVRRPRSVDAPTAS